MTVLAELRTKGYRVRHHGFQPDEILVCCPFCLLRGKTPDNDYNLGINVKKNIGHCFRCEWRSREALEALRSLTTSEVSDADVQQAVEEARRIRPLIEAEQLAKLSTI